jgi:predicted O-methyltransferase YrrM
MNKTSMDKEPGRLAEMIHYTAMHSKFLLGMPETPAVLRGYLATEEGVALMLLAAHGPSAGAIVEIGSFLGKSTSWLALGSKSTGREKVAAVDWFRPLSFMAESSDPEDKAIHERGSTYPFFLANLKRFGVEGQVTPIVAPSAEAAATWNGDAIRLLFIDGNHLYESVLKDFFLWSPFVRSGGIIAIHDYLPQWSGIVRFYDEHIAPDPGYSELFQCHSMKVVLKH